MDTDLRELAESVDGADPRVGGHPDEGPHADRAADVRMRDVGELDQRPRGQPGDVPQERGPDQRFGPDPSAFADRPLARPDRPADRRDRLVLADADDRCIDPERRVPLRTASAGRAARPQPRYVPSRSDDSRKICGAGGGRCSAGDPANFCVGTNAVGFASL